MSSRVRYIVKYNGGWMAGSEARKVVKRYSAHPLPNAAAFAAEVKRQGGEVWIFREPRTVSYARSRYKKFCNYLGIGRRPKKKAPMFVPQLVFKAAKKIPVKVQYNAVPQEYVLGNQGYINANAEQIGAAGQAPGQAVHFPGADPLFG